jgi:hypothetical protein
MGLLSAAVALFLLVVGCAGDGAGQPGSSPPTPLTPVASPPPQDYKSFVEYLRRAGLAVKEGEDIEQFFFSVKGRSLLVNNDTVMVFEYKKPTLADAEATRISPDGFKVEMTENGRKTVSNLSWLATPHFYKRERLVVLHIGDDPALQAAIEAALGPQFAGG